MPRKTSTRSERRNKFRKIIEKLATERGQPARLGTAGGTVYFDDGTTEHKDRVWVRMGAEDQVLVVARTLRQGIPNKPGLAVQVIELYEELYVVDWEGSQAGPHIHDFDIRNVVVGFDAGGSASGSVNSNDNVFVGHEAGINLGIGGQRNIGIGRRAAQSLTNGDENVCIGGFAGVGDLGSRNVSVGDFAGVDLTSGSDNVFIGHDSRRVEDGDHNVFVGGETEAASGSVSGSVAIGSRAGHTSIGDRNVFIGRLAGPGGQPGADDCVIIGYQAGANYASAGHHQLIIDANPNNLDRPGLIFGEFDLGNVGFNTDEMGGGEGVIGILDATTVPTSNPTGGGVMYSDGGAGKWRSSGGTVTTFGPAEPHCPACGSDFAVEYESKKYGYLTMCLKCLADELGDRPWIQRSK